jgi:3-oxo-5-alpha-steroid 4-dehydrogenase 1
MWLLSEHWRSVDNLTWMIGMLIWLAGAKHRDTSPACTCHVCRLCELRADAKALHAGAALNVQSDYHLLHLRAQKGAGYHIPTAGAFQVVSCPNFLGEILEWIGYAIACSHLAGVAFAWCDSTSVVQLCACFLHSSCLLACMQVVSGWMPHVEAFMDSIACRFTICNLAPRALQHHQFYLQMFRGAYPSGRKALIPYIL